MRSYEATKKWRQAHPEEARELGRKYAERYRRKRGIQKRIKIPVEIYPGMTSTEYSRAWRKKNPEKYKEANRRRSVVRRARLKEKREKMAAITEAANNAKAKGLELRMKA